MVVNFRYLPYLHVHILKSIGYYLNERQQMHPPLFLDTLSCYGYMTVKSPS